MATAGRSCFIQPGQALHDAAPILAVVATLAENGDVPATQFALRCIDIDACHRYWWDSGVENRRRHRKEVHRYTTRREANPQVTRQMKLQLGERDGWCCRYCGLRVVHPGFFPALKALLPHEFPDSPAPIAGTAWPVYRVFDASPDHIVPLWAGGPHTLDNLVTSCGTCNYQMKTSCLLDELGLAPPGPPVPVAGWDGLLGRPTLSA